MLAASLRDALSWKRDGTGLRIRAFALEACSSMRGCFGDRGNDNKRSDKLNVAQHLSVEREVEASEQGGDFYASPPDTVRHQLCPR
jgi:hypothetical protein